MSNTIGGNCLALHVLGERGATSRWVLSAAVIVGLHAGAVAAALALQVPSPPPGSPTAAILIDLAPSSTSPQTTPLDLAPGPEMQQAAESAPPPEPEPETAAAAAIAPTPPQPSPVVTLPAADKIEPAEKPAEQRKQQVARQKPVKRQREAKLHQSEQPPAPRTSATPRAERSAPTLTGSVAGAQAAMSLPSYRALLAAHLQRFKQYPAASRAAGEQGTAMLSFVVARNGRVLSSRLASSSGYGALDAETMAMIQRAQPLPSFPDDVPHAQMSFSVPVRFSVR